MDAKEEGHFTYGFGRRICAGRHVSNNSLFIAMVLWTMSIERATDEEGVVLPLYVDGCVEDRLVVYIPISSYSQSEKLTCNLTLCSTVVRRRSSAKLRPDSRRWWPFWRSTNILVIKYQPKSRPLDTQGSICPYGFLCVDSTSNINVIILRSFRLKHLKPAYSVLAIRCHT